MGTRSDGKNDQLVTIAKNTGLGIPGKLYFMAVRFLLAVFITRTIGPEKYGIYMLALSFVEVLGLMVLFGIDTAMVRFVSHHMARNEFGHVKGVISLGTRVAAISGLCIGGGTFLMADLIGADIFRKPELAHVLRIMILSLPFVALMNVILSALEGSRLIKYRIVVEQVARPTVRFILVAAAFGIGWRLMGVVWAWVIASFIAFLLSGYFLIREERKVHGEIVRKSMKDIFKFSLTVWIDRMLSKNNRIIGVLLIGVFLTADQAGIYSVGQRIIPLVLIPFMAFNTIYSPIISGLFAKNSLNELEATYKVGSRWIIGLTLPIFVLMMAFSKEIVLVFGKGFADSHKVLLVLLISQMINVGTGSTSSVLSMTGKPIYNLVNSVIALLLNVSLCIVMIKKFSTVGAAYSLGISIVVVNFLQIAEVYYLYRIHPFSLAQLKLLASCMLSLIVVFVLSTAFHSLPMYLNVAMVSGSFLSCYVMFLLLFGLSAEDRMIWQKIHDRINCYRSRKRVSIKRAKPSGA